MLNEVIIMNVHSIDIIRWVNIDTFNCTDKVFFESAECEKVIPMDEHVTWPRFPVGESAGFDLTKTIFRGVKEQTRLYGKRLVFLANPRKFQFIYLILCHIIFCLTMNFQNVLNLNTNFQIPQNGIL